MRSFRFAARTLSCAVWMLLATPLPSSAQPLPGEPPAPAATGRDAGEAPGQDVGRLYDAALEHFRAGRYAEAHSGFSRVWSLEKKPRTAGNLGWTEMKLAMYAPAAEHLSYFLREQKGLDPEEREEVTRLLSQAKARVGALRIHVAQPGARVSIDGRAIGTAPLSDEIYVDPGRRKVEALLGERKATAEVEANAGGTATVHLDVAPAVIPPAPSPTPPPPPPPSPRATGSGRALLPGLVVGGAGAAALLAGAGSLIGYADRKSQSEKLHGEIVRAGGKCIPGSAHPACPALLDATRTGDTLQHVGIGLLVTGGIVTALSAGYLLWVKTSDDEHAARLRWSAAVSPEGAAAGVSGSF